MCSMVYLIILEHITNCIFVNAFKKRSIIKHVGRMSVSLLLVSTYTSNKQLATKQSKKHTQIERNKPQIHAIGFVVKGVNLTSTK